MPADLKTVLKHAGIAKPTYDARRRRDIHGWLHVVAGGLPPVDHIAFEYEVKRKKFGAEHLAGLMIFEKLCSMFGLSQEISDYIVSNRFFDIAAQCDEKSPYCIGAEFCVGVIFFEEGMNHISGSRRECLSQFERHDRYQPEKGYADTGIVLLDAWPIIKQAKDLISTSEASAKAK